MIPTRETEGLRTLCVDKHELVKTDVMLKLREHFVTLAAGLKRRSQVTDKGVTGHGSRVAGYGSQVTDMIIINSNYFNDEKVIEYRVTYFATQQKRVRLVTYMKLK